MTSAKIGQQFNFGMSFAFGAATPAAVVNVLARSQFEVTQVSDRVALDPDFKKLYLRSIDICNLFPLSLTRSISEQSSRIIDEFVSQFTEIIEKRDTYSFNSLTLDVEPGSVAGERECNSNRLSLLKRLGLKLSGKDITLCLPVRIPYATNDLAESSFKFLSELMCPDYQFCVDIHPHELPLDYSVDELMRWYQFDTKTIRFIYEPELGNNLVLDHLKPWIVFLTKNCFRGNIFFAPVISDETHLSHEITSLQSMIAEL